MRRAELQVSLRNDNVRMVFVGFMQLVRERGFGDVICLVERSPAELLDGGVHVNVVVAVLLRREALAEQAE